MLKSLPNPQKEAIDSAFKDSKNVQEKGRFQVIRLLSQGYSHKETARITGKSPITVEALVTLFNHHGVEGLKLKPKASNNAKLTLAQKDEIREILHQKKQPSLAGLAVAADEDFWSVRTLKLLVKSKFRLIYKGLDSYRRLLRYCHFTYQRVEFSDRRKNPQGLRGFKRRAKLKLKKGGTISMWW